MNALRVLGQCTKSLADVLDELYEPGWKGHDLYGDYSDVSEVVMVVKVADLMLVTLMCM